MESRLSLTIIVAMKLVDTVCEGMRFYQSRHFMHLFIFFKRMASKPLPVVLFRFRQEAILWLRFISGYWGKFSYKIETYACQSDSSNLSTVLMPACPVNLNELQRKALYETASSIIASQFKIFGHTVPNLEDCDFASDWRFNKKWPNQYYKKYKFYEEKNIPYDVKFPWELSRLHYLVPVLAWQWADKTNYVILEKIFKFDTIDSDEFTENATRK